MQQTSAQKEVLGSLKIAFVVGIILSGINQYDVILSGELEIKTGIKIFLNFLVPFLVASYSKHQLKKNV